MKKKIQIIKRKVKYARLELRAGEPVLIMPRYGSVNKKWLERKLKFIKDIKQKYKNQQIYNRSEEELVQLVSRFIEKYSRVLNMQPLKLNFRYMRTKWGSCSGKNRISFNLLLGYLPLALIRYIVFHEMVHLLIKNHSKKFWMVIEKEFKNYKKCKEKLFGYWFLLNKPKEDVERPKKVEDRVEHGRND